MMFLPFYKEPAEMIPQQMILLLIVLLSVSLGHEFPVFQPKTRDIQADGSATIDCELHGLNMSWDMQISLKRKPSDSIVCLVSNKPDFLQYDNNECVWRNSSINHFHFTLFHLKRDDETVYVCEFIRSFPIPVKKYRGTGTKLVSETPPVQAYSPAYIVPQCPEPGPLNWVLMGLAGFLLLCCITVTCAYIRLRVKQEKDMDGSLTYVPMQPPQMQNMRNGDAENNTTYEDMRKMQSQGRTSRRDMNYNSHQMAY